MLNIYVFVDQMALSSLNAIRSSFNEEIIVELVQTVISLPILSLVFVYA